MRKKLFIFFLLLLCLTGCGTQPLSKEKEAKICAKALVERLNNGKKGALLELFEEPKKVDKNALIKFSHMHGKIKKAYVYIDDVSCSRSIEDGGTQINVDGVSILLFGEKTTYRADANFEEKDGKVFLSSLYISTGMTEAARNAGKIGKDSNAVFVFDDSLDSVPSKPYAIVGGEILSWNKSAKPLCLNKPTKKWKNKQYENFVGVFGKSGGEFYQKKYYQSTEKTKFVELLVSDEGTILGMQTVTEKGSGISILE